MGDLPTLIKEFYVRSAVRAERTRAAHLLLRMSTGHSWCALTASPTKCSTHRFPSRSATRSHRMPQSGIKATRASASPQNNIICSFGGPDKTMCVGSTPQNKRARGKSSSSRKWRLPTLIKEFYVRSAVRAERTRAAHLLLRMSTGHSWCALTASPTKCSTHRFPRYCMPRKSTDILKAPDVFRHRGLKNGGYLLSHNMQYHRRC